MYVRQTKRRNSLRYVWQTSWQVRLNFDTFVDLKEDIAMHINCGWKLNMEIADGPGSDRLALVKIDPSWLKF